MVLPAPWGSDLALTSKHILCVARSFNVFPLSPQFEALTLFKRMKFIAWKFLIGKTVECMHTMKRRAGFFISFHISSYDAFVFLPGRVLKSARCFRRRLKLSVIKLKFRFSPLSLRCCSLLRRRRSTIVCIAQKNPQDELLNFFYGREIVMFSFYVWVASAKERERVDTKNVFVDEEKFWKNVCRPPRICTQILHTESIFHQKGGEKARGAREEHQSFLRELVVCWFGT